MELLNISGHPILVNWKQAIRAEDFGDLKPGQKIQKVGVPGKSGCITSSSRVDTWEPFIEYVGITEVLGIVDKEITCLAFLLPKDGVYSEKEIEESSFYKIYSVVGNGELISWIGASTRIFKSIFITPEGEKIKGL